MYRSVFLLAVVSACSPYNPELGNAPYLCASEDPQCPDGYTCQQIGTQNVCVNGSGTGPGVDSSLPTDSRPGDSMSTDGPLPDASGTCATFTGMLATWSLTGQAGSQASTPAITGTSGVTAGPLMRGGALTPQSGTNSMNSSGWSTGALDKTKYYTVSLTAPSGCTMSVTEVALDATASGTGPSSAQIGTSADTFAATKPGSTSTAAAIAITASGSPIEIRIYGVGATASTGTMRIQNTLIVSGTLQN